MKRLSIETFIKRIFSLNRKKVIGASMVLVAVSVFSGSLVSQAQAPTTASEELAITTYSAENREAALSELASEIKRLAFDKEQILWLARVLYSETKRPAEMRYIAWVVRNRVDVGHRAFDYHAGLNSYKGAALASSQFSGLHPRLDRNATSNLAMSYETIGNGAWDQAVKIAEEVYYSDGSDRPFASNVTHFYSPSVIAPPAWAYSGNKVLQVGGNRFAFYADII